MTAMETILDIERHFWLDGAAYFKTHMLPGAVMVFPLPASILSGEQIIEALQEAPRWDDVEFGACKILEHGKFAMLSYHAKGHRAGAEDYDAQCVSGYVLGDGGWMLANHQQMPARH